MVFLPLSVPFPTPEVDTGVKRTSDPTSSGRLMTQNGKLARLLAQSE